MRVRRFEKKDFAQILLHIIVNFNCHAFHKVYSKLKAHSLSYNCLKGSFTIMNIKIKYRIVYFKK